MSSISSPPPIESTLSYINSSTAQKLDEMLMSQPGFSLDQLMELAGLAVAQSVHSYISKYVKINQINSNSNSNSKILILAGPGNNGGDGLVAARHLMHFGYQPTICYPKVGKTPLFKNLVKQCHDLDIPFLEVENVLQSDGLSSYALIVDSLFGFSFKGPPQPPYQGLINAMASSSSSHSRVPPVLSVDVPSGWDIELGDTFATGFVPAAVISLTLPKICMKGYHGVHYIGGRFVPPTVASAFNVQMPDYGFGDAQILELNTCTIKDSSLSSST